MIDIVGYVTKTRGESGFMIKVTSDKIEYPPFNNVQILKEVEVHIDKYRYPDDNDTVFKRVSGQNDSRRDLIDKCRSLSDALKLGDRVKCSVCIVETEIRNGQEAYVINRNRNDIETYAKFPLWLYPNKDSFISD